MQVPEVAAAGLERSGVLIEPTLSVPALCSGKRAVAVRSRRSTNYPASSPPRTFVSEVVKQRRSSDLC